MSLYCIADIVVDSKNGSGYFENRLLPFKIDNYQNVNMKLEFNMCESIDTPQGDILLNEGVKWLRKKPEGSGLYGYMTGDYCDVVITALDCDENWENNIIDFVQNTVKLPGLIDPSDIFTFQFAGTAFRNRIIHLDGIVIHASSIEYEGKGILFSAPSGTGKSTHVRLWEEIKKSVRVLNDDSPALRRIGGKTFIYGTPWSGSSDKFLNENAPLELIVILEQSPTNFIRELPKHEAIARLLPRLFLPYMDTVLMDIAINTFEKIICSTPVYLLSCRPDAEAVEMVYQCMK